MQCNAAECRHIADSVCLYRNPYTNDCSCPSKKMNEAFARSWEGRASLGRGTAWLYDCGPAELVRLPQEPSRRTSAEQREVKVGVHDGFVLLCATEPHCAKPEEFSCVVKNPRTGDCTCPYEGEFPEVRHHRLARLTAGNSEFSERPLPPVPFGHEYSFGCGAFVPDRIKERDAKLGE